MLWTEAETKALTKWVNRFGTDFEEIGKRIKTKSIQQIKDKVYYHSYFPSSHGETLFTNLKINSEKNWTKDEKRDFWRVIEKHGVDEKELLKALPNRRIAGIRRKVRKLYKKIKARPEHERAHLL